MSARPLILVTGASGFIAQHVILDLLRSGYDVRGTLRSLARADEVLGVLKRSAPEADGRLSFVETNLESDAGWNAAAAGVAAVMHVASPIPLEQPKDKDALVGPARDGALRVLRAARDEGVRRVVMTASIASVVDGHGASNGRVFTEADWTVPDGRGVTPYARSKTLAERAAWDFVAREGSHLSLTTILPGLVFGPVLSADYGVSPEVIRRLLAGEVPGAPRIGWSIVDVRDVARMHVLALESDAAQGERFVCTNDFLWMADIAAVLREACPTHAKKVPKNTVPDFVLKLMGLRDPVVRSLVAELGRTVTVSHDKAARLLGWTPLSAREATAATGRSMVELALVGGPR